MSSPSTAEDPFPDIGMGTKLLCGAGAGIVAQTLTYPLDLIRRRFQVMQVMKQFHYKSTLHAFITIFTTEGLRGLYRGSNLVSFHSLWCMRTGCLPNYLKVAPSMSVSFVVYEQVRILLHAI